MTPINAEANSGTCRMDQVLPVRDLDRGFRVAVPAGIDAVDIVPRDDSRVGRPYLVAPRYESISRSQSGDDVRSSRAWLIPSRKGLRTGRAIA